MFWMLLAVYFMPVSSGVHEEQQVVVVGGGLAGLSATIEAALDGAKVTLVEGEARVGGNSAKASSGISGCPTSVQKLYNIDDSAALFYKDTMHAGDELNKADLVDVLVKNSASAVEWLRAAGVELNSINILGGHARPRTHWIPTEKGSRPRPVGVEIVKTLKSRLQQITDERPNQITVRLETKMLELQTGESGEVTGVKVQLPDGSTEVLLSNYVVLATGGFGNDHTPDSLLQEFAPHYMQVPTTNGPFAQGAGVKVARKIGARLHGMEHVQIHPTGFIDPKNPKSSTKFLAAEALRGSGALLVNQKGARFVNELGRRDRTTEKILAECELNKDAGVKTSWIVLNTASVDKFGWPAFNFYMNVKGFFKRVENTSQLAEQTGINIATFTSSIKDYNKAASGEKKDDFGKTVFPCKYSIDEPLYYGTVTPSIHYTMGGLEIDGHAQVLSQVSGKPIPGLFAAGEVSGGVHGSNRLGGNSLLECVVFGRIAGQSAAAALKKGTILHDDL